MLRDAEAKIDATAALLESLEKHEIIESLIPFADDLQRSFGVFSLVAWMKGPHPDSVFESCPAGWYIVIAAWGLLGIDYGSVDVKLRDLQDKHVPPDLRPQVIGLLRLHPLEGLVSELTQAIQVEGAEFCNISDCVLNGRLLPTAFIIRSRFLPTADAAKLFMPRV